MSKDSKTNPGAKNQRVEGSILNERTQVVHPEKLVLSKENHSLVSPSYTSVKYYFEKMDQAEKLVKGERTGFLYGRILNPSVRELEINLARLQGTEDAYCTSSGLAAISNTLLALLRSGDHLIYMWQSYKPTRGLIQTLQNRFGIESTRVSLLDHGSIEKAIIPGKTKLMIWESPTNPQLEIADMEFLTGLCKKYSLISVLDNTFSGLHNHRQFDVDVYIHSLTKFASGHSDAMGGAVLGSTAMMNRIRWGAFELGDHFSPREAVAISKGLKTYFLRYTKSAENALEIAKFLKTLPKVKNVRYPGLEEHPRHELAKKQLKDFGAVIMFDVDGDKNETYRVIDSLKLFKAAPSLGSVESLVLPVDLFFSGYLDEAQAKASGLGESGIRLSIGIEDVEDLKNDLRSAISGA
jgi:cystathionine beta-lyase/cystathionine gamma-synthase